MPRTGCGGVQSATSGEQMPVSAEEYYHFNLDFNPARVRGEIIATRDDCTAQARCGNASSRRHCGACPGNPCGGSEIATEGIACGASAWTTGSSPVVTKNGQLICCR